MPKPKTWEEYEKLARSPELFQALRTRLVEIAMTEAGAGNRSIEMLTTMGQESVGYNLSDVPTHILEAARDKAAALIREQSSL